MDHAAHHSGIGQGGDLRIGEVGGDNGVNVLRCLRDVIAVHDEQHVDMRQPPLLKFHSVDIGHNLQSCIDEHSAKAVQ